MDTFLWDRCGIVWGSLGNMWGDPCLIFAPPRTASCSDLSHLQPSPCCCDGDGLPSRRASHDLRQFCDVIDDFQIAFVSEVAIQLDLLFCDCSSFLRKHATTSSAASRSAPGWPACARCPSTNATSSRDLPLSSCCSRDLLQKPLLLLWRCFVSL